MNVGDLENNAPGSGARDNAGKLPMDLVPVMYWLGVWEEDLRSPSFSWLARILEELSAWQLGRSDGLREFVHSLPDDLLVEATRVLEFGAKKYNAWNWAKGMPWSVPVGCILRHARAIIEAGEEIDPESGLPHMGHIVCNLLMLDWFSEFYLAGDDRPPINRELIEQE